MIFGIPWFAIIPIVAIVGGLLFAYKEQELKLEGKRLANSRELNELRKIIHNLKNRVDLLERIVNEASESGSNKSTDNPLGSIEIDDEESGNNTAGRGRSSTKT